MLSFGIYNLSNSWSLHFSVPHVSDILLSLGFAAALATLFVIGATLLYLTMQQQETIKVLQKSLYNICMKSLSGQLNSSDSHTDDNEAGNED